MEDIKADSFEDYLEIYLISMLILNHKKEESIIDLSHSKNNIIESLVLRGKYENINENSFDILSNLLNTNHFKSLTFWFSGYEYIFKKWILHFKRCTFLGIERHSLKKLTNENFNGLESLTNLDISGLIEQSIEPRAFVGLNNLVHLSFGSGSFNNIQNLDLTDLKSLKQISIYHNDIQNFTNESLKCNQNLKILTIAHNRFQKFGEQAFTKMIGIEDLTLRGSKMKEPLKINCFQGLDKMQFLCIDYNDIENVCYEQFKDLVNLKYLGLRCNKLKSFEANILNRMQHLEFLDLLGYRGFDIDFDSVHLPNLKFMQLSNVKVPKLTNFPVIQGIQVDEVKHFDEYLFNYENKIGFISIKCTNGEIYDELNENHLFGLKKLKFFEIRINCQFDKSEDGSNVRDDYFRELMVKYIDDDDYGVGWIDETFVMETNTRCLKNFIEKDLDILENLKQYLMK